MVLNKNLMNKKPDKEILNAMSNNFSNWKGPIYFNRKDDRLTVPKRNPALGWTLNFANPYAYAILIVLIGIVVVLKYFIKY